MVPEGFLRHVAIVAVMEKYDFGIGAAFAQAMLASSIPEGNALNKSVRPG
ncbi:MAG: hypothetical protein MK102_16820 [Fuerstiella sp.]|nr:hypothetical protein [Fuerstiella sp.]